MWRRSDSDVYTLLYRPTEGVLFNDHNLASGPSCIKLAPEGETPPEQTSALDQTLLETTSTFVNKSRFVIVRACSRCRKLLSDYSTPLPILSPDAAAIAYHMRAK